VENKKIELSQYRMNQAKETLTVARDCVEGNHYKDSINRSYYAAFYAIKAVLALSEIDFKRHKDVIAHFNKNYVAQGEFNREIGKRIARLQQKREKVIMMIFILLQRMKPLNR